jgi:hypothetical protein
MNMRIQQWITVAGLCSFVFSSQAELTHRYRFNNDVTDAVGTLNGSATPDSTYTEVPLFVTDSPSGAVSDAPSQALQVGMNQGSKKSGFTATPDIISTARGSYSFWMKPDGAMNGAQYIMAALPLTDGPFIKVENGTTDSIQLVIGDDKAEVPGGTVVLNAWNHVAVSWDNPAGTAGLYVNGALVGSTTFSPDSARPTTVRVGGYSMSDDANQLANQWKGRLYDLQFYNTVMDSKTVTALYGQPGNDADHLTSLKLFILH